MMTQPSHDPDAVIALAAHWASRLEGVTNTVDGPYDEDWIASAALDILGRDDIEDLHPEIAFHQGARAVIRMLLAAMNDPFGDPEKTMLEILTTMRPRFASMAADERKYGNKAKLQAERGEQVQ